MKKVQITEALSNYIESLDYTVEALRTLLCDAAARGLQESPAFASWERQYIDAVSRFSIAKSKIAEQFVLPLSGDGAAKWTLDYASHVLTIEEVKQ